MRKFHYTSLFVNAIFQARPSNALFEREMYFWAISKYFGDCVPTQGLKCVFMLLEEQSANQDKRYVSKS